MEKNGCTREEAIGELDKLAEAEMAKTEAAPREKKLARKITREQHNRIVKQKIQQLRAEISGENQIDLTELDELRCQLEEHEQAEDETQDELKRQQKDIRDLHTKNVTLMAQVRELKAYLKAKGTIATLDEATGEFSFEDIPAPRSAVRERSTQGASGSPSMMHPNAGSGSHA